MSENGNDRGTPKHTNRHYDGKVSVSWSAGKDSTVLLDLARRAFPNIPAVFVDTGLEYPEIRKFAKSVPNVTWLRPELTFTKVIGQYGFPVISKDVAKRIYYARKGSRWAIHHLNGYNTGGSPSWYHDKDSGEDVGSELREIPIGSLVLTPK